MVQKLNEEVKMKTQIREGVKGVQKHMFLRSFILETAVGHGVCGKSECESQDTARRQWP